MKIDYISAWTDQSIKVDGNISKQVWAEAAWSSRFVDMVDAGPSIYETKCAILGLRFTRLAEIMIDKASTFGRARIHVALDGHLGILI